VSSIRSLLEVRESFTRRRVTVKSSDRRLDLVSGQTSKQYSSMGRHLLVTKCRKTSSDADLPSLPNNAFTDLKKERLELSKEHLNLQDRIMFLVHSMNEKMTVLIVFC